MAASLPVAPTRTYRYYYNGVRLDQGMSSACVGHGWTHWLTSSPIIQKARPWQDFAFDVYRTAQINDEWEGEEPTYYGTSVRAGAKVLQAQGFITDYRWAFTADEILRAVLDIGPVVVGTVWTDGMFVPYPSGEIKPEGPEAGGHCYLIDGGNALTRRVRILNSWGNWGNKGRAWMSMASLEYLMGLDGEAAIATEVKV